MIQMKQHYVPFEAGHYCRNLTLYQLSVLKCSCAAYPVQVSGHQLVTVPASIYQTVMANMHQELAVMKFTL
jgi:hypothetical protein